MSLSTPINLVDQSFGCWTAIQRNQTRNKRNQILWICHCECGLERLKTASQLREGKTYRCCHAKNKYKVDLTKNKYGRLQPLEHLGNGHWRCLCDCGKEHTTRGERILAGKAKSCGCLAKELGIATITHGGTKLPEFKIWSHMIERCHCDKARNYYCYGGRGITVCDRWRYSFACFLADMGPRPSKKHTVERKNNDGLYAPNNCVWATKKEQDRNRRNNRWLTFNGKTMIIADWAHTIGVVDGTIGKRLKAGWSLEEALTTPPMINQYANKISATTDTA